MGQVFLLLTILTESAAVICMKLSAGFSNKLFSMLAIVAYGLSFVFLTLALKHLPAGIANAVWAGASAVLVATLGILVFKERLTAMQVISMLLIIAGMIGLNIKTG